MTLLLIASAIPLAANLSSTHRTLVTHARGPTRLGFAPFGIMLRAHAVMSTPPCLHLPIPQSTMPFYLGIFATPIFSCTFVHDGHTSLLTNLSFSVPLSTHSWPVPLVWCGGQIDLRPPTLAPRSPKRTFVLATPARVLIPLRDSPLLSAQIRKFARSPTTVD